MIWALLISLSLGGTFASFDDCSRAAFRAATQWHDHNVACVPLDHLG